MSKIIKKCIHCGKEYATFNKLSRFCSKKCNNDYRKSKIPKIICEYCGKEFETNNIDIKRGRKYCSKKCFGLAQIKIDKTPIICECCGKEFIPNKISSNRAKLLKYCSRECYQNRKQQSSFNVKQEVLTNCKYCGKEFKTTEYRLKYGKYYCSKECKIKDNEREVIIKNCEICGKEFETYKTGVDQYQRYCSKECGQKAITDNRIIVKCKQCGEDIIIKENGYKIKKNIYGVFCNNNKCIYDYLSENFSGENSHAWLGGISYAPYCHKFNKKRKRAVRNFFDNTCIICGKHQSELKSELHVHHIHYNKEEGCNGRSFNLVPLCHSCHTTTNHNREYWTQYINQLLEDLFNYGIYSRKYYEIEVMYSED